MSSTFARRPVPSPAAPVQRRAATEPAADVHAAAAHGTAGSGGALPHAERIQAAFGHHDVSHVQAYVGGAAESASRAMGAEAYATGSKVGFRGAPSLFTAAHEAAHVIQQKAGVSLSSGVGAVGDRYEQHADAVAHAVVQGESAEALLDRHAGGGAHAVQRRAVQMDPDRHRRHTARAPHAQPPREAQAESPAPGHAQVPTPAEGHGPAAQLSPEATEEERAEFDTLASQITEASAMATGANARVVQIRQALAASLRTPESADGLHEVEVPAGVVGGGMNRFDLTTAHIRTLLAQCTAAADRTSVGTPVGSVGHFRPQVWLRDAASGRGFGCISLVTETGLAGTGGPSLTTEHCHIDTSTLTHNLGQVVHFRGTPVAEDRMVGNEHRLYVTWVVEVTGVESHSSSGTSVGAEGHGASVGGSRGHDTTMSAASTIQRSYYVRFDEAGTPQLTTESARADLNRGSLTIPAENLPTSERGLVNRYTPVSVLDNDWEITSH